MESGAGLPGTNQSSRSVVVWAGLALVAALLAAGWWGSKRWVTPPSFVAPDGSESAGETLPQDGGSLIASSPAAGGVRVRVVDATNGSPVEGVLVELLSEEPVRRRYGRVRSDARGDARFEAVFAPLVLALAGRSDRFAAALTIARGDVLGERLAVLRLGPGGTITGRVVDDQGAALAGVSLTLADISPWPEPTEHRVIVGKTAPDGSYRIERVLDLPRLVSAREDSFFGAAWSSVIVEARGTGGSARVAHSIQPCGEAIAADLILPRPPTLAGRVIDAGRRPVIGALVSVNPERQRLGQVNLHVVDPQAVADGLADLPGSERFALLEGEALTASDGSFSLSGVGSRPSVLVVPPDGRLEDFPIGPWTPGGAIDGLEFALAEREVLRMRLFDPQGRAILGAPAALDANPMPTGDPAPSRIAPIGGPLTSAWVTSKVDLLAELGEGRELRAQCAPSGDGTFSFALATPLSAIVRLYISAPGFKTRVRECNGRLRQESVIANEQLEPLEALDLLIVRSGELEDPPGSEPQEIFLRACALAPQSVVSDPAHPRPACCGFGMSAQFSMTGRERAVAVPMQDERPFWLSLRSSRGSRAEEVVVGPFRAGAGRQTIEISAMPPGPSLFQRPVASASRRDPRAVDTTVQATLCAFDAVSGAPLPEAEVWVLCDPLGREAWLGRTWTTQADGCATIEGVFAGNWTFVVSAAGHRATLLGPLEIGALNPADEEIDLGEVRLPPVD